MQTETKEKKLIKRTFSRAFAQVTPIICAFCGGKSCKHENWLTNPHSAIRGLNSDWVTTDILATQRPSSRIITEFDIIKQFKEKGINAILNLQEPGEHPFCGDGIHPQSGFSYFPEEFYEHGIYFFNFGWRDMTATSTDILLKILKQMSFILTNGEKLAVHCHAGRGRTGLVIAAWLIYHHKMTAKEAIKLVKAKRKSSISKKAQEEVLFQLEKELKTLRTIFFHSSKLDLDHYLENQKRVLPISSVSEEKYVPKLVLVTLGRLESLLVSGAFDAQQIIHAFYFVNDRDTFTEDWDGKHEKALKSLKDKINHGDYEINDVNDPRYPAQLLLDFLDQFAASAISHKFMEGINRLLKEHTKLTESVKEQLFKEVNRKEFLLFESLARFFFVAIETDENLISIVEMAVTRVCISLLHGRHKHDRLFLKRNLLKLPEDEKVLKLKTFLFEWIESFSEDSRSTTNRRTPNKPVKKSMAEISKEKTFLSKIIRERRNTFFMKPKLENNSLVQHKNQPVSMFTLAEKSEEACSTNMLVGSPNNKQNYAYKQPLEISDKFELPKVISYTRDTFDASPSNYPFLTARSIKSNIQSPKEFRLLPEVKRLDLGPITERGCDRFSDMVTTPPQSNTHRYRDSIVILKSTSEYSPKPTPFRLSARTISTPVQGSKIDELALAIGKLDEKEQDLVVQKLLQLRAQRASKQKGVF